MWNITKKKKAERQLHTAKRLLAEGLDDMSYLHELSTRLSATLELEPMLEEVLAAVMAVQGAEMGLVRLLDRERGDLEIVASVGLPEAFLTRFGRVPPGVAACGMAIARGEPVLIEDVEADPCDAETREAGRIGGFRGDYSTPLVSRSGAMLGTIATFFRDPHRPSERQVRLVELYARQAADFVEAARLHRDLREADRRKDEFLAMLAHELRNPLAAILGEARVLGDEAGDGPALAESREVILRQGRQMTRLVDDLLDASRIRRGDIPLRKVPVEVATEVARAVEAARPLIDARGHELTVSLPPEPLWLEADPVRLVQVLGNLLTNAAKYTEPGGRIALEAVREADFAGRPGAGQRHRDRPGSPAQGLRPLRPGGRDRGSVAGGAGDRAGAGAEPGRAARRVASRPPAPGRAGAASSSSPSPWRRPRPRSRCLGSISPDRRTPRANRDRGGCSSWTTSRTRRGAWPGS